MTENESITGKSERIVSFFKSIDRMLDGIEGLVRNCKPTLNGERYLTENLIMSGNSRDYKMLAGFLSDLGNDLATVLISAFCGVSHVK